MTLASQSHQRQGLEQRNRRTALVLVGWIALLVLASVIVIWVRN